MTHSGSILSLNFDTHPWTFESNGKYMLVEDPRGIRQVYHPWERSDAGDYGSLITHVALPTSWQGPVYLSLYANDTYISGDWGETRIETIVPHATPDVAACQSFVGHRFKQVWIDETVIWEQDVGDPESFDYFSLDISRWVKPGQGFTLTLKVMDKVSSSTRLPGDDFRSGIWSYQASTDPEAENHFYTRVFWADVALSNAKPIPWEENPSYLRSQLILRNPTIPTSSAPVSRSGGRFILDSPCGLPEDGFPVTWGIPFGKGKLQDGSNVRLLDAEGNELPLQTGVQHRWPDGSVRWLLLDFQAPASMAENPITVSYGSEVVRTDTGDGIRIQENDEAIRIDTGALSFHIPKGSGVLAKGFTLKGDSNPLGKVLTGRLMSRDGWERTDFTPIHEEVLLETAGPLRSTVLIKGHLKSGRQTFGRFTCRIHTYRGKPYVRVFFRVFNDTDAPAQLVEEIDLRLLTSMKEGEAALGDQHFKTGMSESDRLLIRQDRRDHYTIFQGNNRILTEGTHWEGPITLRTPEHGVSGGVRYFHQLYPKRMWAGEGGLIVFDLFTRTMDCEQYVMTRGEARRHEVMLYFHKGDISASSLKTVFQAFETRPILISPEWYAEENTFGQAAALTKETFPEFYKGIIEDPGPPDLTCRVPMGFRNWPDTYSDSIYSAYRGVWENIYQELNYGACMVALLSGRREWFDYAEAYDQHFMDIDICHYSKDPRWIGSSYGISTYHTGHQPYPLSAPLGGLFLHYYLTGDPDAKEAAIGIADWLHAADMDMEARTARAIGWPLRSAVIAHENTDDPRHLETARRLAGLALSVAMPRREFFSEPATAWNYRGGSVFTNSILAAGLMLYWRATGDERVGRMCANLACDVAYDWMSPTEPGIVLFEDPLQSLSMAGYSVQFAPMCFWGYEITGDKRLLEKGALIVEKSILDERNRVGPFHLGRYYVLPDILYYYGLCKNTLSDDGQNS